MLLAIFVTVLSRSKITTIHGMAVEYKWQIKEQKVITLEKIL